MAKPLTGPEIVKLISQLPLNSVTEFSLGSVVGPRRQRQHQIKWSCTRPPPAAPGFLECPNCVRLFADFACETWLCPLCGTFAKRDGRAHLDGNYTRLYRMLSPNPPGCTLEVAAAFRLGGIKVAGELSGRMPPVEAREMFEAEIPK
jgi:hypothetical protein